MSSIPHNASPIPNGDGLPLPPGIVRIQILYNPVTVQIAMECNTNNRIIAYGMLGIAQESLLKQSLPQPEASPIVPVRGQLPPSPQG